MKLILLITLLLTGITFAESTVYPVKVTQEGEYRFC